MANVLKKIFDPSIDEVVQNFTIQSWHVSQSVDAFTGVDDYDITISGSLVVTGSVAIHTLPNSPQNGVVLYDDATGLLYYTASSAFAVNNFYTSSISQSITSSVVNNNINNSTITQNITNSVVNDPAPSNQYIQYNSASAFGASIDFQFIYTSSSLQQGNQNIAPGLYSHAEGKGTISSGVGSHAEGQETVSSGAHSHAEGFKTSASFEYSHAEGQQTLANSPYSHAEGNQTQAAGTGSHAEGNTCTTVGNYSHAEGQQTFAQGAHSHAEGAYTTARGTGTHAEGYYTFATGLYSHAEGAYSATDGAYSHAEGYLTTASSNYSHAEGYWNIAAGTYQHVQGQFNRTSSVQSAFIIGNGTSNTSRSNLVHAAGSSFQTSGSLNLSGSFSPQYRYIGSVQVLNVSSGVLLSKADYNVTFQATIVGVGNKNAIQLPSGMDVGSIIYLQRVSGTSACAVSGSSGHTINGSAGFTFPTTVFTRRMFVFTGTGWYVEV
jgi:hypothetical protein